MIRKFLPVLIVFLVLLLVSTTSCGNTETAAHTIEGNYSSTMETNEITADENTAEEVTADEITAKELLAELNENPNKYEEGTIFRVSGQYQGYFTDSPAKWGNYYFRIFTKQAMGIPPGVWCGPFNRINDGEEQIIDEFLSLTEGKPIIVQGEYSEYSKYMGHPGVILKNCRIIK